MSVVIKSRQVKFRNTGSSEYYGVNAISEETTQDMIEQIQAAGDAVIDSIPIDYSELEDLVTTALPVDNTLSVSGKAADAKKVGDEIDDLKEDINQISVETGINYVDQDNILNVSDATFSDEWYSYMPDNAISLYGYNTDGFPHRTFKPSTQYNLSFDGKFTGSGASAGTIGFVYTDDTRSSVAINTTDAHHFSLISTNGKSIAKVYFGKNNNFFTYVKNLMVVEGALEPDTFIPYHDLIANDKVAREYINTISSNLDNLIVDGNVQNKFSIHDAMPGYLTASGVLSGDQLAITRTTDFVSIPDGQTNVTIQTWMTLPDSIVHWQAFCFYDENKNLINTRYIKTGSIDYHVSFTHDIPNGAKFLRASSRIYNDWKIMLQFGTIPTAWVYNADDIAYLATAIDNTPLNTIKWTNAGVKSIAHRGGSTAVPENTMACFKYAIEHGYHYIETDLAFTSDGVPVLLHDSSINRTARNADGTQLSDTVYIYNITYAQALEYDFGIWKGVQYAGEKIPTLAQFLAFCRATGTKFYLELKYNENFPYRAITHIADYFKQYGIYNNATIVSFTQGYLNEVKSLYPDIRLGYITSNVTSDALTYAASLKTSTNDVFIDTNTLSNDIVQDCITAAIPVELWTLSTTVAVLAANPYVTGITAENVNPTEVLFNSIN